MTKKDISKNTTCNTKSLSCENTNSTCKNVTDENKNSLTMQEDETKNTTKSNKTKNLAFWIGVVCVLIVGVQIVLNACGVVFEAKIIVEIISYVLALLVSVGVLNSNLKNKSLLESKNEIQEEMQEILDSNTLKDDNKTVEVKSKENKKEDE